MIRSGAACGAGPPPCSTIVTVSSPDVLKSYFGIRARSSMARAEVPHPLDGGLATKFNPQGCSRSSQTGRAGTPWGSMPPSKPAKGPCKGTFTRDLRWRLRRLAPIDRASGGRFENYWNRSASRPQPDFEFPGGPQCRQTSFRRIFGPIRCHLLMECDYLRVIRPHAGCCIRGRHLA